MTDADYSWPGASQAWLDLPEPVRARMVTAGAEQWQRIFDGRATYNKQWRLARPPVMTADALTTLNRISDRLAQLVLETCQRRARTGAELRALLGVTEERTRLLDDAAPLDERLLAAVRPDVLLSGGVPKFVEFNIDSSLGGALDSDTVVRRFVEIYAERGITELVPMAPAPSAVAERFVAIRTTLGLPEGARVAMLIDFDAEYPGLDNPEWFMSKLAPVVDLARDCAVDLVISPVSTVTLDDQRRLLVDGGTVDAVFRLFVPNRVTPSAGIRALADATAAGLPVFVSAAAWLLGSKQVLAWLWSDLDQLPEDDRALVRRYVPRTETLTADAVERAVAAQQDLVAKPADGSAGVGVLIGRETDPEAWRDGLAKAVEAGGYVLQEYVPADSVPMDFVHIETGETVTEEVPYSIAPYLFDRRGSGVCVRSGFPGCEGVLNLARGVLLSGVLVVD
ncbi:hypothetical protein [Micromonospora echinofusca]|uniref:Circularly permuted ATP-grasp type 2 n=1 Tax=Micromonospora echinofusca TaxID=47858 RepID=A0ABS3VRR4_MICEH|nr:hypothetical protein [Micromonospora echinofusca]MBO4207219.1 hypothetical protein [Micromonospora echinofusca]